MTRAGWLVVALVFVVVVILIPFGIRARFEGFSVPSPSMVPALLPGDYILVDKSVRQAVRGDVVVFRDPADQTQALVKRVVALSGESVTVRDRGVYLDCLPDAEGCRPLVEPYAWFEGPARTPQRFGPFKVPAGAYFVMADNRNAGEDSRVFGAVRWEQLMGGPLIVYWSRDPDTHAVRWNRLGLRVR